MGETEIDVYEIIYNGTKKIVLIATRTEHTKLRGLQTTANWDW